MARVALWIAEGESDQQEFKETTGRRREGSQTLCGFSNLRGGRLIYGVTDKGGIVGQQVSAKTLEDLHAEFGHFDPEVTPSIEQVPTDNPGREIIVVSVPQGRYRPYRYRGQAYQRVGAVTAKMGREEYERLFLETVHGQDRWEVQVSELGVDDLDHDEITRTLDDAVRRGRINQPRSRAPLDVLRGFGLVRGDQLVNAAVVLFADENRLLPLYSQCLVKLVRYDGTDKGNRLLDLRQEHGNAFRLLRTAEAFLREHLRVRASIGTAMERQDEPEIPMVALREAIANAVCHREYGTGAGSVSVEIYDDRVAVTSIGPLHFGLSVADLLQPHQSQPWNPVIAGTLYRRGVIENLGTGTLRMIDATRAVRLFDPEIIATPASVIVDLPRRGALSASLRGAALDDDSYQVLLAVAEDAPASLRSVTQRVAHIDERAVRYQLQRLRAAGLLAVVGTGRGARWQLARSPRG